MSLEKKCLTSPARRRRQHFFREDKEKPARINGCHFRVLYGVAWVKATEALEADQRVSFSATADTHQLKMRDRNLAPCLTR